MHNNKIRFIVNPFSGISNKDGLINKIEEKLDIKKYTYDYKPTQAAGHAIGLAKEAADLNYYMVVAVGGDGTVNEVAQSLVHSNTILGIIPGGSGNGFAMYTGIGRNIDHAFEVINNGEIKTIDSCLVNDQFFINLAGIGFDAQVAYKIKTSPSRGFKLYFKAFITSFLQYKIDEYNVEIGKLKLTEKFILIAIANAGMYGYNFTVAPDAELTDGQFDIVLIKKSSRFRFILSSWRFLNNSIHKSNLATVVKSPQMKISLKEEGYIHVDGEGHKSPTYLDFKIVPSSLKVMFPHSTN